MALANRRTRSSYLKQTLHDFIKIGDAKEVAKLISQGVNINMEEDDDVGLTPLHLASMRGHKEILKLLLDAKADVNLSGEGGDLALAIASDVSTAKIIITAGGDVNFKNQYGYSVLHLAVKKNNLRIIKFLLAAGADPNSVTLYNYYTPLHIACSPLLSINKCSKKIVKCLLENNANINALSLGNYTPLMTFLDHSFGSFEVIPLKPVDEKLERFLRFLLKYFHVDSVTVGIFPRKKLYQIYFQYVAKLLELSVSVQSHYHIIENRPNYGDYFKRCTNELSEAKGTKIYNSWVTYFNLLVDSKRKLKNYAGNKELIKNFKMNDCCEKFPIYGKLIKENVEKGIKRRISFDKSTVLLSDCLSIFNSTHLIIRDILDLFGSKDLLNFCKK